MKKIMTAVAMVLAVTVAGDGWAQQRRGRGAGEAPQVDTSAPVTLQGEVIRLSAGFGGGMPTLVVAAGGEEHQFVLGPFRNLQTQGFAAQAGDQVVVRGFACTGCPNPFAVVAVENLTRGVTLTLRDEDGVPLWQGGRGGRPGPQRGERPSTGQAEAGAGRSMGKGAGPGPDLDQARVFVGTVRDFTGGPGEGVPTLVLATAAGDVTIVVGPYRRLARAGLAIAADMALEVTAAPAGCEGQEHLVALAVKDPATGVEFSLRGEPRGSKHRRGGRF